MQFDVDTDEPIGFRLDGSPIWAYQGGAPEGEDDGDDGGNAGGDDEGDDDDDDEDADESSLTPGGRKAIERERAAAKKARDDLRPFRALMKELGVKSPDEIRRLLQKSSKDEVDPDEIANKARAEVLSQANKRIVKAEIKALAADDFADASDATKFLDLDDYEVDEDGNVDSRRIKADLKALLAEKPHLGKRKTKVDLEGGPRGDRRPAGKQSMDDLIRQVAGRRR